MQWGQTLALWSLHRRNTAFLNRAASAGPGTQQSRAAETVTDHLKETVSSVCTWIQLMKPSYPAVSLLTRCIVYHFCWTLVCRVRWKGCIYESRAGPASSHLAHCSYSASEFEGFVVTLSLHPTVRQCYKHKFHTIPVNEGRVTE